MPFLSIRSVKHAGPGAVEGDPFLTRGLEQEVGQATLQRDPFLSLGTARYVGPRAVPANPVLSSHLEHCLATFSFSICCCSSRKRSMSTICWGSGARVSITSAFIFCRYSPSMIPFSISVSSNSCVNIQFARKIITFYGKIIPGFISPRFRPRHEFPKLQRCMLRQTKPCNDPIH